MRKKNDKLVFYLLKILAKNFKIAVFLDLSSKFQEIR